MVTMAKGGSSILLFNLRKVLNHRFTVLGITALLAVYVLWQAGSLVWQAWLLDQESQQAATLVPIAPKDTGTTSLQDILRYPLIRSAAEQAAADTASTDRPKTSLNLKLVGLMYSPDQKEARAIIENPEDGASSYSVHDRVADKAEIYSIEQDRVILLHAGQQEALLLDPEDQASESGADSSGRPVTDSNKNQAAAAQQSASGQNTPKKLDDLMREFSVTPVMEAGELVGFHLEAVKDPTIMNVLGITPDDVITAVDGVPLNSQGRVMVLYNKLKREGEFELTLNRGGESRRITVDTHE
jgi:general secretion pathway protein C